MQKNWLAISCQSSSIAVGWVDGVLRDYVALTLLQGRTLAESRIGAGKVARNRQAVADQDAGAALGVLQHREAPGERLFLQLFVVSGDLNRLDGLDLHESGNQSRQLRLWRGLIARFYIKFLNAGTWLDL